MQNLDRAITGLITAVPPLLGQLGIHVDPLGSLLGPVLDWALQGIFWLAGVQNVPDL